jgi:hypothetical protein
MWGGVTASEALRAFAKLMNVPAHKILELSS